MTRLVWVRLLFRAMGVLFIGMALPMCFQFLGQLISFAGSNQLRSSWGADWWQILYTLGWGGGGLLQMGFGIYLLFYGKRLREWCMKDIDGRCPRCDYELGAAAPLCPECGLQLASPATPSSTAASNHASPRQETQP